MDLDLSCPAIADLRRRARRRLPHFVFEYLDSATGTEAAKRTGRAAFDRVGFCPAVLKGTVAPDLTVRLFGQDYALPFGVAPVGMSGLIWPGAEVALAGLAARHRLPYCLSTVATETPEVVGPRAGGMGWFQLYPPEGAEMRRDILRRARAAGFGVLVLTVDVPGPSRRERQRRARLALPPDITVAMYRDMLLRPVWLTRTLAHGIPRLKLLESYVSYRGLDPSTQSARSLLLGAPDWDYLAALRTEWDGPLVCKGVLDPDDAVRMKTEGVDGVWISTHGGRQFEAAPPALAVLPAIRAAVGPDYPLILDSGIEGGLDILRAMALGADLVMLGRAWHYALGAFGLRGADHLVHILQSDLVANMAQLGIARPGDAAGRLMRDKPGI